jgi:hypothetical protein
MMMMMMRARRERMEKTRSNFDQFTPLYCMKQYHVSPSCLPILHFPITSMDNRREYTSLSHYSTVNKEIRSGTLFYIVYSIA